jgi:hypothetical protein
MIKTFFIHGDRSGSRFSSAASGYEIRKLKINLISSTEAPVAPASASKASHRQHLIDSRRGGQVIRLSMPGIMMSALVKDD